jgi:L-rhamnose mutarotase
MTRYCFLLHVRPDLLGEYRERHAGVWPEMLRALDATGWCRYSIFARPDGLIVGYVEADNLVEAQAAMASTEVNARWQEDMSRFFVGLDGQAPDVGLQLLEEIFNLDEQLARLETNEPANTPANKPAEGADR